MNKRIILLTLILLLIFFGIFFYFKKSVNENKKEAEIIKTEEDFSASNIIENVEYSSKDTRGNEYIVRAKEGEIDNNNNNIIFLNNVEALVNLNNSNKIFIYADYGKYNIRANKTYSLSLLHYVPYLAEFLLPAPDSKTGQLRIESGVRVCPYFSGTMSHFRSIFNGTFLIEPRGRFKSPIKDTSTT